MDRLFILAIACITQLGCQTPYSPFGGSSTRVPPPPTGSIGNGNYDSPSYRQSPYPPAGLPQSGFPQSGYPQPGSPQSTYPQSGYPPSPYPSYSPNGSPNGGRFTPPRSQSPLGPLPPSLGSYIPPQRGPGETITAVGPWRYWESAQRTPRASLAARTASTPPTTRAVASRPDSLTRNDQLRWTEPVNNELVVSPSSSTTGALDNSDYPTVVRGNNLPTSYNNVSKHNDIDTAAKYIPVPDQTDPRSANASDGWHSSSVEKR